MKSIWASISKEIRLFNVLIVQERYSKPVQVHICRHVILKFGTKVELLLGVGPRNCKRKRLDLRGYCRVIQVLRLVKEKRGKGGKRSKDRDRKVHRRV